MFHHPTELRAAQSPSIVQEKSTPLRKTSVFHHNHHHGGGGGGGGEPNSSNTVRRISFSQDGFGEPQQGTRSYHEVRTSILNLGTASNRSHRQHHGGGDPSLHSSMKCKGAAKPSKTHGTTPGAPPTSARSAHKSGQQTVGLNAASLHYHDHHDSESEAGSAITAHDSLSNHPMFNTDVTHDATLVPALLAQFAVSHVPLLKFEKKGAADKDKPHGKHEGQSKEMILETKKYLDNTDAAWARGGYRKGDDKTSSEIAAKGEDHANIEGDSQQNATSVRKHNSTRPQSASSSLVQRIENKKHARPQTGLSDAKQIQIDTLKKTREWINTWDRSQDYLTRRLEEDLQLLDRHRPDSYATNFTAYGIEKSNFLEVNLMKDMTCMRLEAEKAILEKRVASSDKILQIVKCWSNRGDQISTQERKILAILQQFVSNDILMTHDAFFGLLENLQSESFAIYTVHVLLDFIRRVTDVPLTEYVEWLTKRNMPLPQKARQQQRSVFHAGLKWRMKLGKKDVA
jgi:hypothetical protein